MVYASKEQYLSEHNLIPDEQIERRLKQASRHIDSLTFNRITSRGFDNLTEFQQAIIIDVCCDMADFEYENEDMINQCGCDIESILNTPMEDIEEMIPHCTYTTLIQDYLSYP